MCYICAYGLIGIFHARKRLAETAHHLCTPANITGTGWIYTHKSANAVLHSQKYLSL